MNPIALDTNIAIDLLNGKDDVLQKYEKFQSIYLPVTVCGELLFGALNSESSKNNLLKYRGFISACIILEIDLSIAEQYAAIRKRLKDQGTPIPENDIWIAATCMMHEMQLATNDKHFSNIEGLNLYQ
jgi:tRNA(fMet)-specific endonuclease VapC